MFRRSDARRRESSRHSAWARKAGVVEKRGERATSGVDVRACRMPGHGMSLSQTSTDPAVETTLALRAPVGLIVAILAPPVLPFRSLHPSSSCRVSSAVIIWEYRFAPTGCASTTTICGRPAPVFRRFVCSHR